MYYVNWQVINAAMKRKGITDGELAKKLNIPRQTIVFWRGHKTGPSRKGPELLDKMCDFLGITIESVKKNNMALDFDLREELLAGMLQLLKFEKTLSLTGDDLKERKLLTTSEYTNFTKALEIARKIAGSVYQKLDKN